MTDITNHLNVPAKRTISMECNTHAFAKAVKSALAMKPPLRRMKAVRSEILDDQGLRYVVIKVGDHVRLRGDGQARIAAMDCEPTPGGAVCRRLVLVMDDCTTRVLEHGDALAFYVVGFADFKPRRRYAAGGFTDG